MSKEIDRKIETLRCKIQEEANLMHLRRRALLDILKLEQDGRAQSIYYAPKPKTPSRWFDRLLGR